VVGTCMQPRRTRAATGTWAASRGQGRDRGRDRVVTTAVTTTAAAAAAAAAAAEHRAAGAHAEGATGGGGYRRDQAGALLRRIREAIGYVAIRAAGDGRRAGEVRIPRHAARRCWHRARGAAAGAERACMYTWRLLWRLYGLGRRPGRRRIQTWLLISAYLGVISAYGL
jgi:hypothetical protein